ncbi:oligoendopeptidase F [Neglectibacter caecimuris]|uniref:oligoendopeptidase F n=1 Tax=Neglectibacter caecimuris TaxID=3093658 RepID=UPI002AC8F925|nr:oligoendopeptidase F [Neglectibacter sp. M00184]
MELQKRKDIPAELTWDLSAIYETEEAWAADVEKMEALTAKLERDYRGKLNTPEAINACLDILRELYEILIPASTYRDLAASVDYSDAALQEQNEKMSQLVSQTLSRLSFINSEIIEQDEEVLREAIASGGGNSGYLSDLLRQKPHQLQPETERVLTALSPSFNTPYQVYNMAKLADMRFPTFSAGGQEFPLGYSLYEDDYEYDPRTEVRRNAFTAFYGKLREYENVTAAAYQSQVQTEKTMATLRGFSSVYDSLLFDQKVSRELYDRQIDLIMEKLAPHMRKYAKLLQKIHGLDSMTYADLKLAVDPEYDPKVTIEESREYIEKGLSIMGEEYQEMIRTAYRERWVDFAQNQGKSTGGFCASPYGSHSFILLTWHDRMSDVFTLAHELGHAGHFKSCNAAQSVFDTEVSTYFVEAPSTMNELLMAHYMLKTNPDKRFRRWVLSCMIGNTYYHNFVTHLLEAAYQREVYRIIDNGGSVQAETLNRIMRETLTKFWGDAVELPEGAELTWMRQPHYYMGLYSYTYSAGLTAATQACKRIEAEGQPAVEDWKRVLAAGSTKTPLELAKMAGVDISTDAPLLDTIETIGGIIEEICQLTEELG